MTDFLRSLLASDGMAEGRAAVVSRYEWFTHASLVRDFDLFKAGGLQLRNPGGVDPLFSQVCGADILCLSTFPKRNLIVLNKDGPMFKMAVHRDDLPYRVGIDCSFGRTYEQAQALHEQNTSRPRGDIFLEMVWNREVIISLDPIQPDVSDKYGDSDDFAPPVTIPKGASFKDMIALKGKSDVGDKINTQVIQPLVDANSRLARTDFPDFNDPNKLGEGKDMVDTLSNLIAIFQKPELDFSKNRADHDDKCPCAGCAPGHRELALHMGFRRRPRLEASKETRPRREPPRGRAVSRVS